MNAQVAHLSSIENAEKKTIPQTPRGRALYTIDWFLNGRPILSHHDNKRQSLKNGCAC